MTSLKVLVETSISLLDGKPEIPSYIPSYIFSI